MYEIFPETHQKGGKEMFQIMDVGISSLRSKIPALKGIWRRNFGKYEVFSFQNITSNNMKYYYEVIIQVWST